MPSVASLVERARRVPPWAADLILAVAIFGVGVIDILFFQEAFAPFWVGPGLAIPLFAAMSIPLAIRRRKLWLTYVLIEAAMVTAGQLDLIVSFSLGFLLVANVLLFSIGEQSSGLVTSVATLGQLAEYYSLEFEAHTKDRTFINDALFLVPFFGFAAFAGWAQRRRRRLTADLEAGVAELQRERELLARQAVVKERVRIAGELRALVASGVERMVAQVRTSRAELARDPVIAQHEIGAIEQAGRRTLVEMRRLLGILRRAHDAAGSSPSDDQIEIGSRGRLEQPTVTRGWFHRGRITLRSWLAGPRVSDVLVVVALGALMAIEFARSTPDDPTMSGMAPKLLGGLMLLALLFRRRLPITMLTVVATAEFLWILITGDAPGSADRTLLVAVYSVAAYKSPGWTPLAVTMGTASWSLLPIRTLCICMIEIGTLSTFAAIAGYSMQSGRKLNRQMAEQTEILRKTRAERVRLAVNEERMRVARDMHDVVAHGVTVMVVQAGGARMVAVTDPALAEETLAEIERVGADAVGELRSLVETLDPDSMLLESGHGEAPDVHALMDRLRRTGQQVSFTEEGEAQRLDLGLQISVFRIVQEALTNIRKHAPGATATVLIRHRPQSVEIVVENGRAPKPSAQGSVPGSGQGLVGIRERATLFGGTVEAHTSPAGGFVLDVRLPLELVPA